MTAQEYRQLDTHQEVYFADKAVLEALKIKRPDETEAAGPYMGLDDPTFALAQAVMLSSTIGTNNGFESHQILPTMIKKLALSLARRQTSYDEATTLNIPYMDLCRQRSPGIEEELLSSLGRLAELELPTVSEVAQRYIKERSMQGPVIRRLRRDTRTRYTGSLADLP